MKTIKSWKAILGIALVAGLVSLVGVQVAAAESRGKQADVIFTKWITASPGTGGVKADMKGVVSGDAGPGLFVGEVLELNDMGDITKVTADYHINGGTHTFTARLKVTQNDVNGTAVLRGKVTDGWMKGAEASGDYQVISPSYIVNANGPFGDVAFQGTLHLQRDR